VGRLFIVIPDDLEQRFRRKVGEVYGARRGVLIKAIMEALELWLNVHKGEEGERA
jgi:hypothetical protein